MTAAPVPLLADDIWPNSETAYAVDWTVLRRMGPRHDDVIHLAVESIASQWPGRSRQDLSGHDRVGIIARAGEREAERGEAGVAVKAPECPGRFGCRSLSWYEAERCDARGADRGHEPRGVLLQDRPRQGAQSHRGSAVGQTGRTAQLTAVPFGEHGMLVVTIEERVRGESRSVLREHRVGRPHAELAVQQLCQRSASVAGDRQGYLKLDGEQVRALHEEHAGWAGRRLDQAGSSRGRDLAPGVVEVST